ncbi:acyl-CoA thioesterase [Paraglaciecola sp. 2405UD69-4]|uniref:acyl-CoA thioesterase n=1 Tax=Paraglaciecola sp. 2405UD69-4 TaxID=3391836 RepID=UPI0039C9346F
MSNPTSPKTKIPQLTDYHHLINIDTRWKDNDLYGHVNNVVYYSYFDTIINRYLIEHANLDIHTGSTIGLMVSSQCNYYTSVAFPDKLVGAFAVNKIGNSSVEYDVAIFKEKHVTASARGTMTHVFVDRNTRKPTPISGILRDALTKALKN